MKISFNVNLKLEIKSPQPAEPLGPSDRSRLEETVTIPKVKISPVSLTSRKEVTDSVEPPEIPTPVEIMTKYAVIEEKSQALLDFLNNRIGHELDMPIDPSNQELWGAAHSMFRGKFDRISFNMYRQMLDYMESLGRALPEASGL